MRLQADTRQHKVRPAIVAAVKVASTAALTLALLVPAAAQFWTTQRPAVQPQRPAQGQPQPQAQPQTGYNPFSNFFTPAPTEQQRPVDYSRAPSPRKQDPAAPTKIVVLGDAMADWLAFGLEEAFSENPEIAVIRKHRANSGLVRYDPRRESDWAPVVREALTAEKPKFVVMMIGMHDRQAIRDRAIATRPAGPARANSQPGTAENPEEQAPPNAEQQQSDPEQQPAAATDQSRGASTGPIDFRSDKWEAAYGRRIDATIAAMKSAGVPVFWVGLPTLRGQRASSDMSYLNDIFRARAEKGGVTYVDVWDGFTDEGGRYTAQGPDFEGQIRRLRSGDGVYFTRAGARKLAHYVEREIQRSMINRAIPVALPEFEATPQSGARPGGGTQRPVAGPVVPLTLSTAGSGELLGAGSLRPANTDPVATRVLTRGEPIAAPAGRADDFSWPRTNAPIGNEPIPAVARPPAPPAAPVAARPPQQATTASAQRTNADNANGDARPLTQRRPKSNTAPGAAGTPPRPPQAVGSQQQSAPSWQFWR